jgi:putative membrane protein
MIRILLLIGFTFLFMHLHASGNISKYINMKYAYISQSAIVILILFSMISIYFYYKEDDQHSEACDDCHLGHDHSHDDKRWKKELTYLVFLIPIFTGLLLPVATLDSNIVAKKGFYFPVYKDSDEYSQHQFLQPNTSVYYGKDNHQDMMDRSLKGMLKKNDIMLNDDNYLNALETIYNYPGDFSGKQVQLSGFVYKADDVEKNQVFLFRFGIVHCVADSGVFGMLVELPKNIHPKNDQWFRLTGTLDSIFYQPFKKTIPLLKVSSMERINKPDDPYVYRKY